MSKLPCLLIACLLIAACRPSQPEAVANKSKTIEVANPEEGGAVSTAPVEKTPSQKRPAPRREEPKLDWSPLSLAAGEGSLSCELDYAGQGDGEALTDLDRQSLLAVMAPCVERGVLRLRYTGKIDAKFTALLQRVVHVADELKIGKRVLDLDSVGGMVEDAIKAGDVIAGSHWTLWVREGAVCHSACVLVLAAGDMRMIRGNVGIHRIIRMSSTATTRAQLNEELRAVYGRVRDYLERNGAAVAMADQMMSVPNRNLRLLSTDELQWYGLDGVNPVQDDLDRLRLMRECGQDFVTRRDAFIRAFDNRCRSEVAGLEALNACGIELRKQYGFPDKTCANESPLSEFDLVAVATAPKPASTANAEPAPADAAKTTTQ
ncbi:hypothetical protein J5837_00220 [Pseudoxanthomonas helianthi]|uniref:Secreted protein n=1 Tax=Pseudoxanthomonas helianthi TaxID=1453541 RepID=A0A941AR86_9GAMM|nr:hypothetical protein [Pseudoxanthomonas helianthi]MBP3982831.1 hypothetical protein [Pseudoxanthomonas helianthi]